jgi:hypothetical protein
LAVDGVWRPGEVGGYAIAGVALRRDEAGLTFEVPASPREYTSSAGSPAAALAWLLYPVRVLGAELSLGASWEDTVSESVRGSLLWALRDGEELVARSEVESVTDEVVIPAGQFSGCLRVRTRMTTRDGLASVHHVGRHHSGVRRAWYAPGVGFIKAVHEDGLGFTRVVVATATPDRAGSSYLPLDVGREWRYRWSSPWPGRDGPVVHTDIVRVVRADAGSAFLASSTVGSAVSPDRFLALAQEDARHAESSSDPSGIAAAVEQWLSEAGDADGRADMLSRLVDAYTSAGLTRRAIDARGRLRKAQGTHTSEHGISHALELVAAAEDEECWHALTSTRRLLGLAYREAGRTTESQDALRDSASIAAEAGDVIGAAHGHGWADRFLLEDDIPADDKHGYANGEIRLRAVEDGVGGGDSSSCMYYGYPPGDAGSPLTTFPSHGPYHGVSLLGREVGAQVSDRTRAWTAPGSENVMVTSTLADTAASVTTPAGAFAGCSHIESHHKLGAERPGEYEGRSRLRGYAAGSQLSWFGPGVGLVRSLHKHANGFTSDLTLRNYAGGTENAVAGLHVGSRWEYVCVDESTGTEYEHFVRVAAKIGATWLVVFVTRATARGSA